MSKFNIQVNDFLRDKFSTKDGKIPLWGEIIAGGSVSIRRLRHLSLREISQQLWFFFLSSHMVKID